MRAREIKKWLSDARGDKRPQSHCVGYRPDPSLADLMGALRLSVRVVDFPATAESIAVHLAALDERVAELEERHARRGRE